MSAHKQIKVPLVHYWTYSIHLICNENDVSFVSKSVDLFAMFTLVETLVGQRTLECRYIRSSFERQTRTTLIEAMQRPHNIADLRDPASTVKQLIIELYRMYRRQ